MSNIYKETIVKLVIEILTQYNKRDNLKGLKYIFNHIIRQYGELTNEGKKTTKNLKLIKATHYFSPKAYDIVSKEQPKKWDDIKNKIHYEHIVPINVIINDLFKLREENKLYFNEVKNILNKCEVIIITEKERLLLDKKHKKIGEKSERLNIIELFEENLLKYIIIE